MEKSWENFWTTGKVEDYLSYRNRVTDKEDEKDLSGQKVTLTQEKREDTSQEGFRGTWDSR